MELRFFISVFVLFIFLGCSNRYEILLQGEERIVSIEKTIFPFPELSCGKINLETKIESGYSGVLLLECNDTIVFRYRIYTHKTIYPLQNKTGEWQKVSLKWDMNSSCLLVFVDGQHQTTRLVESDKFKSINQFTIRSFSKKIRVKNIKCHGKANTVPKRLRIVAFGNSTTAYRNSVTGVFAQRLPKLLQKEGTPNIVFNEGVPGSHTGNLSDNNYHKVKHALDRLDKAVLEKNPDIVILNFGLNDSWHDEDNGQPRIPLDAYENNLRFIIKEIQKNGGQVILLTPNALGKQYEKWRYDYTEKYVDVVRKLALDYNLPLVDQWKAFEEYTTAGNDTDDWLLDGLHPNDLWHKELAKRLTESITSMCKILSSY